MRYKRFFYGNGKKLDPYYYESYRDFVGKVKKRYIGTKNPDKSKKIVTPTKKNMFLGVPALVIVLLVALFFVNNFSGFVTFENVQEELEINDINLQIKDKVTFLAAPDNNKNKRMEFELPEGNMILYFDLLDYDNFIDEVVEEKITQVITANVIDLDSKKEVVGDISLKEIEKEIKKLDQKQIEQIEEKSKVVAENFDIIIDEEELDKDDQDYKWGYQVELNNLKFLSKVEVTSEESISVYDENTLRIGDQLLSFKDLIEEGYTISFEKPTLEDVFVEEVVEDVIVDDEEVEEVVEDVFVEEVVEDVIVDDEEVEEVVEDVVIVNEVLQEEVSIIEAITGNLIRGITGFVAKGVFVSDVKYENSLTIYIQKDFTNSSYKVGDIIDLDPTLIVIEISQAEHLNVDRNFVKDIYEEVRVLDNVWSEVIAMGEYVRVTFEVALDNTKDITVYARGNASLEVYEKDGTEIVADFGEIVEGKNQIFLTELNGTQDVFDLKVVGGSLEFDYIVDPVTVTLNSPVDTANLSSGLVTFNCTAFDSLNLSNITLYGNWSGGWHANETRDLTGTSNSTTFTKTLAVGNYEWNCLATDNESQTDWGTSNYSFGISADITTGLIGHWTLDEGSGTSAADSSGNSNTGTLINMDGATDWVDGQINGALDFDGTDDNVEIPNPSLPTGNFTYATWMNTASLSGIIAMFMSPSSGGANELGFFTEEAKLITFVNGGKFTSVTSLSTNTWTHVVLTRSGSAISFYIDGVKDSFTGGTNSTLNFGGCQLYLGLDIDPGSCTSSPGNYFQGKLDDMRIYNRSLSDNDITALFTLNGTPETSPIVTLNSPIDSSIQNNLTVNFSCSVTDDNNITNVSLYGNWGGSWGLNSTTSLTGTSNSTAWLLGLGDNSSYLWNCYSCDGSGQCSFGNSNYSFSTNTAWLSVDPFYDGVSVGNLDNSANWQELSGLASVQNASNDGFMWAQSDGSTDLLLAINLTDATNAGEWTLSGIDGVDYEDLASATIDGVHYVYLADIGDNGNSRNTFIIYRIKEPVINGSNGVISSGDIYAITGEYPSGNLPSHKDAETLLVDPDSGDMYIITKRETVPGVYSLLHNDTYSGTQTFVFEGDMWDIPNASLTTVTGNAVGGDISPDGLEILVKSYAEVFLFQRANNSISIFDTLNSTPLNLTSYVGGGTSAYTSSHPSQEPQGEAITYSRDGQSYFTASEYVSAEGSSAITYPLYRYDRTSETVTTIIFQDGVSPTAGYTGTEDTYIWDLNPDVVYGSNETFVVDINVGDERRGLLKFNLSSIPSGATIIGGRLDLDINTEGQGWTFHRVLSTDWNESSTYNNVVGGAGIDADGSDASMVEDNRNGVTLDNYTGTVRNNMALNTIQSWINGSQNNYGWLVLATDASDGQQFSTSENSVSSERPKLTIRYVEVAADSTEPNVSIVSPLNITYATSSIVFNVSAVDEISMGTCWYSLDSGATNNSMDNFAGSYWNATNSSMVEGSHYVNYYCNDSSGNVNDAEVVTFTKDGVNPTLSVSAPDSVVKINVNDFNFTVNSSDLDLANCSLFLNGVLNQTNSSIASNVEFNFSVSLVGGNYSWDVSCFDNVGNVNSSVGILKIITLNYSNFNTSLTINLSDISDLGNVTDFVIVNNYGKINFSESINLSNGANLDLINISNNSIDLDSTILSQLDKPARLYFYNLTFNDPRILKDNAICADCTEISYNSFSGTFIVDVVGFSVYTTEETPIVDVTEETPIVDEGGGYVAPPSQAYQVASLYGVVIGNKFMDVFIGSGLVKTRNIELYNDRDENATVILNLKELEDILFIDKNELEFELGPYERKDIIVRIVAPEIVGVYEGVLEVDDGVLQEIKISINVNEKKLLFDVRITIPWSHRFIKLGSNLISKVDLTPIIEDAGKDAGFDVTINYIIKDLEDKVFLVENETFLMTEQKYFNREFLTDNLPLGEYVLELELSYSDGTVISRSTFEVREGAGILSYILIYRLMILWFIFGIAILVFVVVLIILLYRKLKK